MATINLGEAEITLLRSILAAVDGGAVAAPEPTPAQFPAEMRARRLGRRAKTDLGGLTKAERSALYHAHPELSQMSKTARAKAWKALVVEYKKTH